MGGPSGPGSRGVNKMSDISEDEFDALIALPIEAVDRIVAQVREAEVRTSSLPTVIDREALSRDLGRARKFPDDDP
jgi:hypothetical protein